MKKEWIIGLVVIAIVIAIIVYPKGGENAGIANPASVYCEEQGGKLEIKTDNTGAQYGLCIFDDGSSCEEWGYYRGECSKGEGNYCLSDSDCVKDSCCHPKGCVAKEKAPSCKEIMCTQVCEPGTLDCGGSCKCENSKCRAIMAE
jgi:putative hemolysin